MLRPKREKPSGTALNKFVRIFSLLMTLIYVGLGIFIMFANNETMNLDIPEDIKWLLGGVLILYGLVRFVRVYQSTSRKKREQNEE